MNGGRPSTRRFSNGPIGTRPTDSPMQSLPRSRENIPAPLTPSASWKSDSVRLMLRYRSRGRKPARKAADSFYDLTARTTYNGHVLSELRRLLQDGGTDLVARSCATHSDDDTQPERAPPMAKTRPVR